ncbi:MAG: hypothetical protein QOF38_4774, partial [Pseudonocardiales bacterium]|nr:hypothetical protein [Pseudonocardiales bacterium]
MTGALIRQVQSVAVALSERVPTVVRPLATPPDPRLK